MILPAILFLAWLEHNVIGTFNSSDYRFIFGPTVRVCYSAGAHDMVGGRGCWGDAGSQERRTEGASPHPCSTKGILRFIRASHNVSYNLHE